MINRGPKNNEKRLPFIKKIPDENWSEGLCLPLSIVLAANIERGKFNCDEDFKAGKFMWFINSKDERRRKKACSALRKEFENVQGLLKDQLPQKDFTFENTCHVLARHYEINIVIHQIKHGIDYPCWIGTGSGKTFKVNQARVDILWERDKDGIGHCDVISPRNTNYKKRYGWHCCFCLKTRFSNSHIHRCSKPYIKTCIGCNRVLMEPKKNYYISDSNRNFYCDGKLKNKKKHCNDCNFTLESQNCFDQHKKSKCHAHWKCSECGQILRTNKGNKEIRIEEHQQYCNVKRVTFCQVCLGHHEKNADCQLKPKSYKDFGKFPKIMVITGAISNPNNSNCYNCSLKIAAAVRTPQPSGSGGASKKCDIHEAITEYEPYINYLCLIREKGIHGEFHISYITEDEGFESNEGVEDPIYNHYEPCFHSQTSDLRKSTHYGQAKKKRNINFVQGFDPGKNVMDILMKLILLEQNFENTVAIVESDLMNFVLKSVTNLQQKLPDIKRGSNNKIKSIELSWTNFRFVSIESYILDYRDWTSIKNGPFFPLVMNVQQVHSDFTKEPNLNHYFNLDDTKRERMEKEYYYKSLPQDPDGFMFDREMKKYLLEVASGLLHACLKLQSVTYAIQMSVKENYQGITQEIGSIYRCPSTIGFFYYILVSYCTYGLKTPILSLKNGETGVFQSNCSNKEFVFQKFIRYKRKNNELHASHLSALGGKRFFKQYPDIYDFSEKEILEFRGCYFHGHIDCANYRKGAVTKSGRSYEEENLHFDNKMKTLKKNFPEIKTTTSVWECDFDKELKRPENKDFSEKIKPNLRAFDRLKPRESLFGGIRQLYTLKWLKSDNENSSLYFLDLNSAYSEAARISNIPFGNYEILIDEAVKDIAFENGKLIKLHSHKTVKGGFIKCLVLQNVKQEPFFAVRSELNGKIRTFHPSCAECLKKKYRGACTHEAKLRAIGKSNLR